MKRRLPDDWATHLLEPSTIRGIMWVAGCLTALAFLWKDDLKSATEVLSLAGFAAGMTGALTSDMKMVQDVTKED